MERSGGGSVSERETVFERMLRGEVPADVVYQDEHVFAFRDSRPQAPVHVLVIPRRKARSLTELADWDAAAAGEFVRGIARVAATLGLSENGYRVVVNSGRDAQQSVDYLHAHLIAGRRLGWPPG
jgi:histidine triad (HIT) family protein